jgi:hypothetical protein
MDSVSAATQYCIACNGHLGFKEDLVMRKIMLILVAMLCVSGAVAAQDNTTATLVADPAPATASRMSSSSYPWQVGMNFTYQRFDMGKGNANLYGIQTSVTRWISDSQVGIEGTVTATFGRFSPLVREQVVFYGGGIKVGKREGKYQPWAHLLAGGAHDRFNQGVGPPAFNTWGFLGGGGVDLQWRSHIAWRAQVDFLGTHFGGVFQKTINVGGGIVFDF